MSNHTGWVGVDLDGTLALYDGWKGIEHIGEPIVEPTPSADIHKRHTVFDYVQELLQLGVEVRILTARVQEGPIAIMHIENWCLKHFGKILPVTDKKDFGMLFLLDDRAYRVTCNTGFIAPMDSPPHPEDVAKQINWHWSPENPNSPTYAGSK